MAEKKNTGKDWSKEDMRTDLMKALAKRTESSKLNPSLFSPDKIKKIKAGASNPPANMKDYKKYFQ